MAAMLVAIALGVAAAEPPAPAGIAASHLYDLAGATGVVPSSWGRVTYDRAHREAFVAADGFVRVFNNSGMEIHRFGDDGELGAIASVAVLEDGALLVLTSLEGRQRVLRCDFRGERTGEVVPSGLPPALGELAPDEMVYARGDLFLLDSRRLRVLVTDAEGAYRRWIDLHALVKVEAKKRSDFDVGGFGVDAAGNVLVSMPMLATVSVISPAGEVRGFGTRGSAPGKFNIVGAVAGDEAGNTFVVDRLRSVVLAFDPAFRFLGEFGYRGESEENLVTPYALAVGNGLVFVAQGAGRGVRVFKVAFR